MGKNLTIKSRVIIVVSVIIAIITVAAIISSYNIFYNNIFATTKQTQFRIATFLSDIVYEEMKAKGLAIQSISSLISYDQPAESISSKLEKFKNINDALNVYAGFEDNEFIMNTSSINSIPKNFNFKVRNWYKDGIKSSGVVIKAKTVVNEDFYAQLIKWGGVKLSEPSERRKEFKKYCKKIISQYK